jgi:hypothetical protein
LTYGPCSHLGKRILGGSHLAEQSQAFVEGVEVARLQGFEQASASRVLVLSRMHQPQLILRITPLSALKPATSRN